LLVYWGSVIALIEQHRAEIDAICRTRRVRTLQLFGSAAHGTFDDATSDLDFFVEFASYDAPTLADDWFGLQEDLERVLGRKVDLVVPSGVKNPLFLSHASRNVVTLYAA
jgi:uncharacterized protein